VVCATLLPAAPRLTSGQLRARLWRALLAVDPHWARRRYLRAVRGRTVTAVLDDDGTVTLTGSGLPADEAGVACARVDRLAEAVKRAGHPGRLGQIAADVYLGLLDGRWHGLSEDQLADTLLQHRRSEDDASRDVAAEEAGHRSSAPTTAKPDAHGAAEETGTDPATGATNAPGAGSRGRPGAVDGEIEAGAPTVLFGPSGSRSAWV
jgi:hypothetical protein